MEEGGDMDEFIYEKTARFVSLIPLKTDSETFNGLPDVWCNSQQFLDLKAGGYIYIDKLKFYFRNYYKF